MALHGFCLDTDDLTVWVLGFFRVYLPLPQQCVPNPCSFWLLQQSQAEDILTHEIVKLDGFDW